MAYQGKSINQSTNKQTSKQKIKKHPKTRTRKIRSLENKKLKPMGWLVSCLVVWDRIKTTTQLLLYKSTALYRFPKITRREGCNEASSVRVYPIIKSRFKFVFGCPRKTFWHSKKIREDTKKKKTTIALP